MLKRYLLRQWWRYLAWRHDCLALERDFYQDPAQANYHWIKHEYYKEKAK